MSTAAELYDQQELYLIKGEEQVLELDLGVDLTGVTLTLHVRAPGAVSDAIVEPLSLDDPVPPATVPTTATLTLAASDKADLDPKIIYRHKVTDSNGRAYRRGPAFVLAEWP